MASELPRDALWRLLCLLGLSWGVSRAKKCRQSFAKTTFLQVVFLVSRSCTWLSKAPPDLSQASLGAQMAPKRLPKAIQNWVKNGSKKGSSFGLPFDAFWGPFWGPKRRDGRDPFSRFFRVARDGHRHHLHQHPELPSGLILMSFRSFLVV